MPRCMHTRRIRDQLVADRFAAVSFHPLAVLLFLITTVISTPVDASNGWWDDIKKRFWPSYDSKSKYRIYDSGRVVLHHGRGASGFYWLNNQELLFIGVQIARDPSEEFGERTTYSLEKWNIRTGAINKQRDFDRARPYLCVFADYVYIGLSHRDGTREVYHGPVGAEKLDSPERSFNRHLCRPADTLPALPNWTKGRDVYWLQTLDGGFIDFGEPKHALQFDALKLYRHGADQKRGIELPLYRNRVMPHFTFYPFKDAYFVESDWSHHPRPIDAPYPVWWLHQDGRVEKITDIPWGPWRSRASFSVVPTRAGLVLTSSNARSKKDLGDAGLYLLADGTVEHLVPGWIAGHGLMVSPDGCKVAFTRAAEITRKENFLHVIELCAQSVP